MTYEPVLPAGPVKFFENLEVPRLALTMNDTVVLAAHFALMKAQLLQLRQAVHLAAALGRVLILPQVGELPPPVGELPVLGRVLILPQEGLDTAIKPLVSHSATGKFNSPTK